MPPREGLPGLDDSIPFSPGPLHHLFIVIHGAGNPYVDQQPWFTSLESSLTQLKRNFALIADNQNRRTRSSFPSVLFLPVEWHCPAFETWQAEVRHADPHPALPGTPTTVREAVAETVGDILLMASPFWRKTIATHVAKQIAEQVAAVRRNRPAFTGRVSLLVHSVGAMVAVELLDGNMLGELQLDSVMFAGCPIPAYAALAPDGAGERQKALAVVREQRKVIRFINVFHPLDPVAYRLEPFVGEGEVRAAIRVKPQRRTFWDDAGEFWDDVGYSLWATLFPAGDERGAEGSRVADLFSMFRGNNRGTGSVRERGVSRTGREEGGIRRSSSYVIPAGEVKRVEVDEVKREFRTGGREVLLSDRIDYELQDGMRVPPFDVMASWGAIKAHTYYWQSLDVAQILMDIAVTSDDAMASR